jgi:heme exporter protein CcmD
MARRRSRRPPLEGIKMTTHWLHVLLSWGAVLSVFAILAISALSRHRAAKRQLAQLERQK